MSPSPAQRRRDYQAADAKLRKREARQARREAERIPKCTCAVRMWSGVCLPECPRGLKTGKRYETWDDVPNDVLLADRYEERNGHPPPRCPSPNHGATYGPGFGPLEPPYVYESGGCRSCAIRERYPERYKAAP